MLISAAVAVPSFTQEKKTDTEPKEKSEKLEKEKDRDKKEVKDAKKIYAVYKEAMLEDFETNQYTSKNMKANAVEPDKMEVKILDQHPAPANESKKYLGVKLFGRKGDSYLIYPAKDIVIDKHCKEITVWALGKKFSGELSIFIQDVKEKNHRLVFGKLNFKGWQKLTIQVPKEVNQQDEYLNQKKFVKVLHIQYRPGNESRLPVWQYFYLDNLAAKVREKYTDIQQDEW
jgi:hypothetical protein